MRLPGVNYVGGLVDSLLLFLLRYCCLSGFVPLASSIRPKDQRLQQQRRKQLGRLWETQTIHATMAL